MKRRSILDLKRSPKPMVATRQLDSGRWQVAIMLPGALEAIVFDRPTWRGADNELIHQLRKHGHSYGYKTWDTLQEAWDNG